MMTTTLRGGITVLAHEKGLKHGIAKTFANRTQARAALRTLLLMGVRAELWTRGRPIYIKIND